MTKDSTVSDFIPSLIAGTISGIIFVVSAVALAALIFTGPLSSYLPQGIGILLVGSIIFALFSALTATYPLILSAPQDIPIAILALMAVSIGAGINGQMVAEEAFQFIFVAIGVTSVLVGLFFWILGRFRLGKLVRFIPFPVVGGFLAGTGWLIVKFSFTMMTDMDLTLVNLEHFIEGDILFQWFPGLVFAVVMLLAGRRFSHYLLTPGILTGSIILFYGLMFAQGFTFGELENRGFLLGPFPEGGLFPGFPFEYVPDFRWDLFLVHLPAIATMMILSAISVLFNYSGLELIVKEDFDLDKELRLTGYSNILAGIAGTPAGYLTLSETSLAYNIGSRSRLPSIIVAVFCGIALLIGAQALSIFPKVILGGLLLNLGLEFLVEWLVDTWKRLHNSDYLVIVLILIVIGTVGFLEGIVIGLLMSIALFVINYSKVEVVKYELTGKTFNSNVERSEYLRKILDDNGDQIFILPLQGFIFFGTANKLLQRVLDRIESDTSNSMKYLLSDFRQVTGMDSSAVNSFNKLKIMAENHQFQILLCGLNEDINEQLKIEGLIPDDSNIIQTFVDLDHGLEWCEEQIIQTVLKDSGDLDRLRDNSQFRNMLSDISEYLEEQDVPADMVIIEQGKKAGGIYFLESGHFTVRLDSGKEKQIRLKTLGPGTIVGEVSLYLGSKASASVVTDVDCRIYYLSKENFKKLQLEAPEKTTMLHSYVVKLLSDRLAESNATIQAFMR
ncbi:MAG: SulP family inorganic anion transporter [Candidatus Neomarinimicrobiota bacterium]|nr:SulP family inorganic anion transporter [Candidatus Neomarinimicrobiota bacterium]